MIDNGRRTKVPAGGRPKVQSRYKFEVEVEARSSVQVHRCTDVIYGSESSEFRELCAFRKVENHEGKA